jgi:hypothetical protein
LEVPLSPILVRPVREQLEHDRVIRLLQAKYKRKFDVAINQGQAQTVPVGGGPFPWYPDLVLQDTQKHRKLQGVVEVETTESVNHLEAMSQWASFAKLRVPFHLYVPVNSVDSARRLCAHLQISTDEIWSYHAVGDQLRFELVQRSAASEARPGRHGFCGGCAGEPPLPLAEGTSQARRQPGTGGVGRESHRRKHPRPRPAALRVVRSDRSQSRTA